MSEPEQVKNLVLNQFLLTLLLPVNMAVNEALLVSLCGLKAHSGSCVRVKVSYVTCLPAAQVALHFYVEILSLHETV